MKVNKTAIFVEGQTELIFVRDLLMKAYDYQNLYINCFELGSDGSFKDKNSPFGHKSADFYFQIVLVGNDNSVLSAMLRREKWLEQQGFGRIIGLRDMYSADYLKQAGHRMIKNELNEKKKMHGLLCHVFYSFYFLFYFVFKVFNGNLMGG